jgi:hypothetical protein
MASIEISGPRGCTTATGQAALRLRLLRAVVDVAAEENSSLVIPVWVELLRFFDRASAGGAAGRW